MSHHAIGSYSDPWTRQKAAQAKQALARRGVLGQTPAPAPSAEPPPPKKPAVGLMVGWAALLLISVGMFYKVTSGSPVTANRRRRSSRRRSTRRSTRRRTSRRPRRSARSSSWQGRRYKRLTMASRKRMPASSFVFPDRGTAGEWPIKGPPGSSRDRDKWQAWMAIRYLRMGRVGSRSDYLKIRNAIIREYGKNFWTLMQGPSWAEIEKAKRRRRATVAKVRKRRSSRRKSTRRKKKLAANPVVNKVIFWGYSKHHKRWWVEAPNMSVRFYSNEQEAKRVADRLSADYDMRTRRADRRMDKLIESVERHIARDRAQRATTKRARGAKTKRARRTKTKR